MAKSDFDKRQEILLEFVYWVFDSFLIPLIRSNFHVTESNVHRQRLFYFRHDVWRMLSEPSLATLKVDLFEEVPTERATKLLSVRSLGFSNIRLLPKRGGVRLITNLKRRAQVVRNGNTKLSRSINSVMDPAFRIITYEKVGYSLLLRCAMLTSTSCYILRNLAVRCSRSATCFPSWHPLSSRCKSKGSLIAHFILLKLTFSPALILFPKSACFPWLRAFCRCKSTRQASM